MSSAFRRDAASKEFGVAVAKARRGLELTQRELASFLGTNPVNIKQIENEGGTPKSKLFFPLCEALGIAPEELGFTGVSKEAIDEWLMQR